MTRHCPGPRMVRSRRRWAVGSRFTAGSSRTRTLPSRSASRTLSGRGLLDSRAAEHQRTLALVVDHDRFDDHRGVCAVAVGWGVLCPHFKNLSRQAPERRLDPLVARPLLGGAGLQRVQFGSHVGAVTQLRWLPDLLIGEQAVAAADGCRSAPVPAAATTTARTRT